MIFSPSRPDLRAVRCSAEPGSLGLLAAGYAWPCSLDVIDGLRKGQRNV